MGVGGADERGCREFGEPAVLRVARQFGGRPCESAVAWHDRSLSLSAALALHPMGGTCHGGPRKLECPVRAKGVTNGCRRGDDVVPAGRCDDTVRRVVGCSSGTLGATTPAA